MGLAIPWREPREPAANLVGGLGSTDAAAIPANAFILRKVDNNWVVMPLPPDAGRFFPREGGPGGRGPGGDGNNGGGGGNNPDNGGGGNGGGNGGGRRGMGPSTLVITQDGKDSNKYYHAAVVQTDSPSNTLRNRHNPMPIGPKGVRFSQAS